MPHLGTVAAACLLVGTLAPAPSAFAGEPPTCLGMPATIVGESVDRIYGTEGDDVIVATNVPIVVAGAGADRVCMMGEARHHKLNAGPGDDLIDLSAIYYGGVDVLLGEGNDSYLGTPGTDWVDAADEALGVVDADDIDTGEGWDHVTSGQPDHPVSDTVDLGTDGDLLKLAGYPTSQASYDAGQTPYDRIELDGGGKGWLIDQRDHRISRDDHPGTAAVAGFNIVDIVDAPRVNYTGGELAEALIAPGAVEAVMGGGNDEIAITASSARRLGQIDMGAGSDTLSIEAHPADGVTNRVSVDLRRGFTLVTGSTTVRRRVATERILLEGIYDVHVRGSARANLIMVWGACEVWMDGDRGPDRMFVHAGSCGRPVTMFGGPGDDRLTGMRADDRLYGGSGHDIATGRKGNDLCVAEVRRSCEQP